MKEVEGQLAAIYSETESPEVGAVVLVELAGYRDPQVAIVLGFREDSGDGLPGIILRRVEDHHVAKTAH